MMSLMAGLLAKKEDLEALRAAFKAMDTDNDGFLSPKEIEAAEKNAVVGASILSKALGPKEQWSKILMSVDLNGDGQLDYHEFIAAALSARSIDDAMIRQAFNILDKDGDG